MSKQPKPITEAKFMSYAELRANIVNRMRDGGDGIKNCGLVNAAFELIRIHLPRSSGSPANLINDTHGLEVDIADRHSEFCDNPSKHPSAFL